MAFKISTETAEIRQACRLRCAEVGARSIMVITCRCKCALHDHVLELHGSTADPGMTWLIIHFRPRLWWNIKQPSAFCATCPARVLQLH